MNLLKIALEGFGYAADASFGFPWRVPRRGFVSPHVERVRAPRRERGPDGGVRPAPGPRFYLQRVRGLLLQVSTMILPQVHLRKPCYDF